MKDLSMREGYLAEQAKLREGSRGVELDNETRTITSETSKDFWNKLNEASKSIN